MEYLLAPLITDWIQSLTGIGGLIALWWIYKTFKLQQETVLLQLKTTEIEQKRFLAEIRPDVDFLFDWDIMKLHITAKNRALRISKFTFNEIVDGLSIVQDITRLQGMVIPTNSSIRISFTFTKEVDEGALLFELTIHHSDELGNGFLSSCLLYNNHEPATKIGPF